MPTGSPHCHLSSPTGYTFSKDSFLGLVNVLEWLMKHKDTLHLLDVRFIINQYRTQEELHRARYGVWEKGMELLSSLLGHFSISVFRYLLILEATWTPTFSVFVEASVHTHHGWTCWPKVKDSTSSPSPFPGGQGVETERSNLSVIRLVPQHPVPIIRWFSDVISLT